MQLQHICGKVLEVQAWDTHGEIVLDIQDPETGRQITHCSECGEEIHNETLFRMDFFPEIFAEMVEQRWRYEMDTPRVEPMEYQKAAKTKKYYKCAGCWSELVILTYKPNPRLVLAACPNCNCPGYVSKRYVERAQSESYAKAHDAKVNLREAVPFLNNNAGKQVKDILAELGY